MKKIIGLLSLFLGVGGYALARKVQQLKRVQISFGKFKILSLSGSLVEASVSIMFDSSLPFTIKYSVQPLLFYFKGNILASTSSTAGVIQPGKNVVLTKSSWRNAEVIELARATFLDDEAMVSCQGIIRLSVASVGIDIPVAFEVDARQEFQKYVQSKISMA